MSHIELPSAIQNPISLRSPAITQFLNSHLRHISDHRLQLLSAAQVSTIVDLTPLMGIATITQRLAGIVLPNDNIRFVYMAEVGNKGKSQSCRVVLTDDQSDIKIQVNTLTQSSVLKRPRIKRSVSFNIPEEFKEQYDLFDLPVTITPEGIQTLHQQVPDELVEAFIRDYGFSYAFLQNATYVAFMGKEVLLPNIPSNLDPKRIYNSLTRCQDTQEQVSDPLLFPCTIGQVQY